MIGIPRSSSLLLLAVLFAPAAAGQAPPAQFSQGELLDGVQHLRASVASLQVSYSFNMDNPAEPHAYARLHGTCTLKGNEVYWDFTYGRAVEFDTNSFHRVVAYNGMTTTSEQVTIGQAFIKQGQHPDARSQGQGFFDLAMWNPPSGGRAPDDQSLVSLLSSASAIVRPSQEAVDDNWCHVVDLMDGTGGAPSMSVWIDCHRGFLPVRQLFSERSDPAHVYLEFRIQDALEVLPGVWFPTRGLKIVSPVAGDVALSNGPRSTLQVDVDANNHFAISANVPVDDSLFNLSERIPPGFVVANLDTKEFRTASGADYNAAGSALKSAIANADLQLETHGVKNQLVARDLTVARSTKLSWLDALVAFGGAVTITGMTLSLKPARRMVGFSA